MHMLACFGMNGDDVSASIRIGSDERINRVNHQMHIKRLAAVAAQGFDNGRSKGQIGDEMAVHHIHMDPIGTGNINGSDLCPELGKIC